MDYLGYFAGFLTAVAFIPQVWKAWKTADTRALSFPTLLMYWIGIALWLVYGALIESNPIIVANGVSLLLVTLLIEAKRRYR